MNTFYHADFEENKSYHIFNRSNNKEDIFLSEENCGFFIERFEKYVHPLVNTFCWNFLSNHFHFLVEIRSATDVKDYLRTIKSKQLSMTEAGFLSEKVAFAELIEHEWQRLFISYAKGFNKVEDRTGNLFNRPFKRLEIFSEDHFKQVCVYIHANAQKHGVCKDFRDYSFSSWNELLSGCDTLISRQKMYEIFGGKRNFIQYHLETVSRLYTTKR